ncbi:hypothetical protein [Acinetobacter baumannii]|uniref:hypothetical protein n=1 Tax=Acinetobacter baumannii TaxID=470 RepID=UPI000952281C|nr:hypothetical protein [Acinetobacter baumannii]
MAEGLLHWHSNSLTYLYGKDYKIDSPIQQTVTFEHVNGWKYGDTFFFVAMSESMRLIQPRAEALGASRHDGIGRQ